MSTFISEPGTRLGGRYRLEDRIAAAGGWAAWKAIDEILARAGHRHYLRARVPAGPRGRDGRAGGQPAHRRPADPGLRRRGRLGPRLHRDGVGGRRLAGRPAGRRADRPGAARRGSSPRPPRRCRSRTPPGSPTCACSPESLRWTPGGGVKIIGLGIDAALSGVTAEDPAAGRHPRPGQPAVRGADRALARPGLPRPAARAVRRRAARAAPAGHGPACPAVLDDITCRALFQQDRRGAAALSTPGAAGRGADRGDPAGPAAEAAPPQPTRGYPAGAYPGSRSRPAPARPHRLRAGPACRPAAADDRPPRPAPAAASGPRATSSRSRRCWCWWWSRRSPSGRWPCTGPRSHGQPPSSVQSPSSPSTQAAQRAEADRRAGRVGDRAPRPRWPSTAARRPPGPPSTTWATRSSAG